MILERVAWRHGKLGVPGPIHYQCTIVGIDPLHVTLRGAHSGLPWRTTGAVFCGENVQRLPLPLVCKEGKDPFFS
jgi:hypothetical protein